ncbi:MAG: protein-tyrosine phosphatase [Frankiaceae bacterium]|nr:protein-tyrosine phosphatase [Frankiaceae bacterium]MDX6274391.1 protein-tyrosine phosphatase [Frankiales bacterium]
MSWIPLSGAANVRDLGGLPLADGGATSYGELVRADNLQGLTGEDVDLLVGMGLSTVVDLRSPYEVLAEGPGPLVGVVEHRTHSLVPEAGAGTDIDADYLMLRREHVGARFPADPVVAFYLAYLSDRPESVVGALRAVSEAKGAAVVHCAAGKDRTGVVIALALAVAGVEREAIVADYAATGERIGDILARLRASPTYVADIDRLPDEKHKPRAESMAVFLDQLDADWGGPLGWLEANGFQAPDVERLRTKLR